MIFFQDARLTLESEVLKFFLEFPNSAKFLVGMTETTLKLVILLREI
jgi:hypothetical protein